MKIVVVHPRYCIRAQKQLEGLLKNRYYEIILIIDEKRYGAKVSQVVRNNVEIHSISFRDSWIKKVKLLRLMKKVSVGAEVIHCHNEPDFHIVQILSYFKGKIPIVYDIHDLASMRSGLEIADEAISYKNVDAIIHVSHKLLQHSENKYGPQNTHVIMSFPSRKNIIPRKQSLKTTPPYRFVYQGGLVDTDHEDNMLFAYRNYHEIFRSILKEGHTVHAFPNNVHTRLPAYQKLEEEFDTFKLFNKLPYPELLQKLSEYDFGIVGFNMNFSMEISTKNYLHAALGNKLFDYIFAGIPPIVINADEMADFVTQNNCGIVKGDDKSWTETISQTNTDWDFTAVTEKYCMEEEAKKLIDLYADLSGKYSKK